MLVEALAILVVVLPATTYLVLLLVLSFTGKSKFKHHCQFINSKKPGAPETKTKILLKHKTVITYFKIPLKCNSTVLK